MAIEIKQIIDCAFSFTIYTSNPVTQDTNQVCIKISVGHAVPGYKAGTPYKLTYDKSTKECSILELSNHSSGVFSE